MQNETPSQDLKSDTHLSNEIVGSERLNRRILDLLLGLANAILEDLEHQSLHMQVKNRALMNTSELGC